MYTEINIKLGGICLVLYQRFIYAAKRHSPAVIPQPRWKNADFRLSLPPERGGGAGKQTVWNHHGALAFRRPLQMAADAGKRRRRVLYHRNCQPVWEIWKMGGNDFPVLRKPSLPLDSPGTQTLFRRRRAPLQRKRQRGLWRLQQPSSERRIPRPRADSSVRRCGTLYNRRPGRRPKKPYCAGRRPLLPRSGSPHLPAR